MGGRRLVGFALGVLSASLGLVCALWVGHRPRGIHLGAASWGALFSPTRAIGQRDLAIGVASRCLGAEQQLPRQHRGGFFLLLTDPRVGSHFSSKKNCLRVTITASDEGSFKLCIHLHFHSSSVHFSSVTQSSLTLCDPMNRSRQGLPVHHQLPEFTHTHVH